MQIKHLVGPMRKLVDQCGVPAQNLVWVPMHWSDLSKIQKIWQLNQTIADILHYNAATGAAARAANLTVFDTYNDTVGATTIDGLHMTSPVTLRKINKLLSLLQATQAAAILGPAICMAHWRVCGRYEQTGSAPENCTQLALYWTSAHHPGFEDGVNLPNTRRIVGVLANSQASASQSAELKREWVAQCAPSVPL